MASETLEQPIAASQIAVRLRAVARAVAHQELEGLKVSPATIEELRRVARCEISTQDVIANIYARFDNVSIFRP